MAQTPCPHADPHHERVQKVNGGRPWGWRCRGFAPRALTDYSICPKNPDHPPRIHVDGRGWRCNACIREQYAANPEPQRARVRALGSSPAGSGYRQVVKASRRGLVDEMKASTPCADCGQRFEAVQMDFDHVPERGIKEFELSRGLGYAWERILAEIAKCDIVCSNCHRLRTFRRRQHLVDP